MITYNDNFFGLYNLLRVHGSAAYKVLLPSMLSTCLLAVFWSILPAHSPDRDVRLIQHPYCIGAFLSFFSFLLTFRLNYGYQRYWDSVTAVHQMLSKWLDAAMYTAAFQYQCKPQFADIYPPSCYELMTAKNNYTTSNASGYNIVLGRDRGFQDRSLRETQEAIDECWKDEQEQQETKNHKGWKQMLNPRKKIVKGKVVHDKQASNPPPYKKNINKSADSADYKNDLSSRIPIPKRFQDQFTLGSQLHKQQSLRHKLVKQSRASLSLTTSQDARVPTPSLFLQELAHLMSLLTAVSMSTLRNDIEEAESPLVEYIPGTSWPPVDPDDLPNEIKQEYGEKFTIWRWVYFMLGLSRSPRKRTMYNAARPFAVLGGVSDNEIVMLQKARGPYAKVALCTQWVQEFITREYLHGSTGDVSPPIISRLYQFVSDGMGGYHQARKVSRIPFPFIHAQAIAIFSLFILIIMPLLFYSFVQNFGWAMVLNFTTVACFLGIHEVARELEDPMQNAPNDLPLSTYQSQFCEALVTMYAGYHPDSWQQVQTKPLTREKVQEEA